MANCYHGIHECDPAFYAHHHPDLHGLSADQAREHFARYGRDEGRPGVAGATRETLPVVRASGAATLEIGPFGKPFLTGPGVRYADVHSTEALRALATPQNGMRPDSVPDIHYDLSVIRLREIPERFAQAFSSHCIEHQPDLIGHLNDIGAVLEPGGAYIVICPDKRYCFDHFRPLSTLIDVIAASIDGRRHHDTRTVLASFLLSAHNDQTRHWAGDHGQPAGETDDGLWHAAMAAARKRGPDYIDAHAWQFTPESFADICERLHTLRLIDLVPEAVFETPKYRQEFCAILRRARPC